jgi:hypothetical protein
MKEKELAFINVNEVEEPLVYRLNLLKIQDINKLLE